MADKTLKKYNLLTTEDRERTEKIFLQEGWEVRKKDDKFDWAFGKKK